MTQTGLNGTQRSRIFWCFVLTVMGSIPGPATHSFHSSFFRSKRPLLFDPSKYDDLNMKQMFAMPERGDTSIFLQNKYQDPVRFEPLTYRLPIRRLTDWATGAWSKPREKVAMWFGMVNYWASLLRSKRQTFPFLSKDNVIDGFICTFGHILNHYVWLIMTSGEIKLNPKCSYSVQPSAVSLSPNFFLSWSTGLGNEESKNLLWQVLVLVSLWVFISPVLLPTVNFAINQRLILPKTYLFFCSNQRKYINRLIQPNLNQYSFSISCS